MKIINNVIIKNSYLIACQLIFIKNVLAHKFTTTKIFRILRKIFVVKDAAQISETLNALKIHQKASFSIMAYLLHEF